MKTNYFLTILSLAALALLPGCHDDPEPAPTPVDRPQWSIDYTGQDTEPTWTDEVPQSGKYQFSMTASVTLSDYLERFADDRDIIAAFVGDECRGAVKSQVYEGERLFLLHIRGGVESRKVSLKYYSARNRRIYQCRELFDFEPNESYGSLTQPAAPPFDESAKYPEAMTATLFVVGNQISGSHDSDMLAAFVGDECRGVATPVIDDGRPVYIMEIRGRKEETADIRFKYYSHLMSGIFTAKESFSFSDGNNIGTSSAPFRLTMTPVAE